MSAAGVAASARRRTSVFNPAALGAPLHIRYDAQTQTAASGATITTLTDQSSSGNNGTKAGSGNVTYNLTGINGHPAFDFPSGPYFDTPVFTSIPVSTPIYIFAVIQLASITADRNIVTSTSGFNLQLNSTTTAWAMTRGGAAVTGGTPNTSPHRIRGFFAPSTAAATSAVYIDGALVAGPGSGGTVAQTQWRIGATSSGFGNFTGKLGELLAYRGALTGAEVTSIESYLSAKWGI